MGQDAKKVGPYGLATGGRLHSGAARYGRNSGTGSCPTDDSRKVNRAAAEGSVALHLVVAERREAVDSAIAETACV